MPHCIKVMMILWLEVELCFLFLEAIGISYTNYKTILDFYCSLFSDTVILEKSGLPVKKIITKKREWWICPQNKGYSSLSWESVIENMCMKEFLLKVLESNSTA
jgi:hypothetical protein